MNITKPKNNKFFTKLYAALAQIQSRLDRIDCSYKVSGFTIKIEDPSDDAISIVKKTVCEIFDCSKPKKHCKINTWDNNAYVQFKKKL